MLLIMAVLLTLGLFASSAGAAGYTDTAMHYAATAIDRWSSYGVLSGDGNRFRPSDSITRAGFIAMIANTLQLEEMASNPFADVSLNDWYHDAVLKCVAAGIVSADSSRFYPDKTMPREQALVTIANAFRIPYFEGGTAQFTDANSISTWARAPIGGLARANLISGASGKVMPQDNLSRGGALQLIDNIVKCYLPVGNTSYDKHVTGKTIIAAPGVTIHDVTLNGDVFVTQGVGSGTVTFNNVIINGDLYVNGGGTNSVLLRGRTRVNGIYVHTTVATGAVRVSLQDNSECEAVYAEKQSQDIYLEGVINRVLIDSDTRVYFDRATVRETELNGIRSEVRINSNSTVKLITADADHATAYVAGTVDRVLINPDAVGTIIEAGRTGVITDVTTWANDVQVIGAGKVNFVMVKDGDNVRVTVEGALVYVDPDAGRVITGDGLDDFIDPGHEGIVGSGDMEHALNVSSVSLDSDGSILVDFSKAPDKTKANSVANYTLSGDGINYTVNKATRPTYAEVSGNTVRLTFRGAKFATMNAGESIIITAANLTGADGSPLGVASGIYRVASNDANLLPGSTLEEISVELLDENTVAWTGNTTYPGVITSGKSLDEISIPLKVTLPVRLAETPTLVLKRSASAAKIKYTKVGRVGSAPTVATQYDQSKLTNMTKILDGDRIYLQVTAPDGKTAKYYKITVTVVDHLRLTDISREGSSSKILRFSFDQIDPEKEDYIRFADYSDNINSITSVNGLGGTSINWIPIVPDSTGQGHIILNLDDAQHQAIVASLSSQTYVHSGKNTNGTIVRTKTPVSQVGIGRNQETSNNLRDDKIYFTTWEQGILKVYGLMPQDFYIVELIRGTNSDNNVLQSGPSGILSLDSPLGVTGVSIRRIDPTGSNGDPAIEERLVLGDPIYIESFTMNLNSATGPSISVPNSSQRDAGWRIRVGSFSFTGNHLDFPVSIASTTAKFKRFGIDDLANSLQPGTYVVSSNKYDESGSISKTATGNNNISTRFNPTIKINESPTTTAARFILTDKILFQFPTAPGAANIIIADGSAQDYQNQNTPAFLEVRPSFSSVFTNGKIELMTNSIKSKYDDGKARSAYLVTSETNEAFTLTKAIPISPWLYESYRNWNANDYTLVAATGYSDVNKIASRSTTVTVDLDTTPPSTDVKRIIMIDGINYLFEESLNSTLRTQILYSYPIGTTFKVNPNNASPNTSQLSSLRVVASGGIQLDFANAGDFDTPFTLTGTGGTITLNNAATGKNLILTGSFRSGTNFTAGELTVSGTSIYEGETPNGVYVNTDNNATFTVGISSQLLIRGSSRFRYDTTEMVYDFASAPTSDINVNTATKFKLSSGLALNVAASVQVTLRDAGNHEVAVIPGALRLRIIGNTIQLVTIPSSGNAIMYTDATFLIPSGTVTNLSFNASTAPISGTFQLPTGTYVAVGADGNPTTNYTGTFWLRQGTSNSGYEITVSGVGSLSPNGVNLNTTGANFTIRTSTTVPAPPPPPPEEED
jgi:hypothetical protein